MSITRLTAKRILILDDDPWVLGNLSESLRAPQLQIVTCSEVEAAQCLLKRHRFDVLISPLEASSLGGLERAHLIRRAAVHSPDMEVIVLNGDLSQEVRELAAAIGVKELLLKSDDLDRLRGLLGTGLPARSDVVMAPEPAEVLHVLSLDEILESGAISAVLQPIVGLVSTSNAVGGFAVEGFARGPAGAVSSPETLLEYASNKERLFEAELQCIDAVLREAWHVPAAGKLFINASARSLSSPGFAAACVRLVSAHGFEHGDIVFELTKQRPAIDLKPLRAALRTFRDHGFGLALDDFGSGLGDLHLLQQLPLDYVKIDGLFCRGIESDPRKQEVVRSVLDLARRLGISTIMEHVETASELEVVRELGASYAQGHYFSRPMPGKELAGTFVPPIPTDGAEDSTSRTAASSSERQQHDRRKHEVSNLLTAIALHAAQSLKRVKEDDPLYKNLEEIVSASELAVTLSES